MSEEAKTPMQRLRGALPAEESDAEFDAACTSLREPNGTAESPRPFAELREGLYERQLNAVDKALGFPHPDGLGRIEMIEQLKAASSGVYDGEYCERHELWWSGPYKCCPVCHMSQWCSEPVKGGGCDSGVSAARLKPSWRRFRVSDLDDMLEEVPTDTPMTAGQLVLLSDMLALTESIQQLRERIELAKQGIDEWLGCRKAKALGCDCRVAGQSAADRLDDVLKILNSQQEKS